jgi:hypothetical protein
MGGRGVSRRSRKPPARTRADPVNARPQECACKRGPGKSGSPPSCRPRPMDNGRLRSKDGHPQDARQPITQNYFHLTSISSRRVGESYQTFVSTPG